MPPQNRIKVIMIIFHSCLYPRYLLFTSVKMCGLSPLAVFTYFTNHPFFLGRERQNLPIEIYLEL